MGFTIERRTDQHVCILHIEGDIDVAVVPSVRAAIDKAVDTGCVNVVLDLERVGYADSSALGLLVWLDQRLDPLDGKAILAGANEDVARIFELSGILSVVDHLEQGESAQSALAGFDAPVSVTGPEWVESLEVPADVSVLADVRERVSDMVSSLDFSDSALFDIKVALGEALANAIRHGSPVDDSVGVGLTVTGYADRVVIDVIDSGAGFDGDHVCSDDLYAVGGRGIMFMRALMDQVLFSCEAGGGTRVTLVKLRPSRAASQEA